VEFEQMKILITIPHYYRYQKDAIYGSMKKDPAPRIEALTQCISSLHQQFGPSQYFMDYFNQEAFPANLSSRHQLDVMVCTTDGCHLLDELSLPKSDYIHVPTKAQPLMLGFECAQIMKQNNGDYDFFCFMEDDLIISDPHFFQKLQWFAKSTSNHNLLQPNRFEVSPNHVAKKCYIDGMIANIFNYISFYSTDGPEITANFYSADIQFSQPMNPHSGCFFLNAEQFEHWTNQSYFSEIDTSFIGPLESAASLGIMKTFNIYKPAPPNANFLEIKHHGNAYIQRVGGTIELVNASSQETM
jgi:hypothetical protein